jgi:hypothetical protein
MSEPTEIDGQMLLPNLAMTIPEILKALELHTGAFPREAMQTAIRQREAITPELLRVVEAVAEEPAAYASRKDYMLHLFALFLLAQFREPRAYGPLVKMCRLPEKTAEDLFGDIVTDGLNRILASVYDGDPAPLHTLIENEAVYDFVRGAALNALVILAFAGRMPKEEVAGYFRSLFQGKLARTASFVWDELVCCVADLRAPELLEDARQACAEELVDPRVADFDGIERDSGREPELNPSAVLITDAIAEMEKWSGFQVDDLGPHEPAKLADSPWEPPPLPLVDNYDYEVSEPVRREGPKIGRNESCPCGSGKKYKKCCGKG